MNLVQDNQEWTNVVNSTESDGFIWMEIQWECSNCGSTNDHWNISSGTKNYFFCVNCEQLWFE